ncbi:hypothetical protein L208DRAFT_1381088 [Tricholoma matsutake]|nr:hypothetical protein L208DRAFT_1381088 [Tricholoma matsutake 945]
MVREPRPDHTWYPSIRSVLQQLSSTLLFGAFMSGEVVQESENTPRDSQGPTEDEVWEDDEPVQQHYDNGPIGDSDDDTDTEAPNKVLEKPKKGLFMFPPSIEQAEKAYNDLTNILKPWWISNEAFLLQLYRHVKEGYGRFAMASCIPPDSTEPWTQHIYGLNFA